MRFQVYGIVSVDGVLMYYLAMIARYKISQFVLDDGPCLGYRPEPGKPYKWITYGTVRFILLRG